MKNFLTAILFLTYLSAKGQDFSSTVSGKVTDRSGKPLPFASVLIEGSKLGVLTDDYGSYTLKNIPLGEHNIVVSFIGYTTLSKDIEISENTKKTMFI